MTSISINETMLRNYEAASSKVGKEHYSAVWDLPFYSCFSEIIKDYQVWPNFLSNGIAQAMSGGKYAGIGRNLAGVEIVNEKEVSRYISAYKSLCSIAGKDFVDRLLEGKIGNPDYVFYEGKKIIFHDLRLIFNAWRLSERLGDKINNPIVFVEIGAGYGALAGKLKKILGKSKIIIIDLPEANAIQTYFMSRVFPDKKLFLYEDFEKNGFQEFVDGECEIAVLPAFAFKGLAEKSVDVFINIRSMMEMTPGIIGGYFDGIHRMLRPGGMFYCVNRYYKEEVGVPIRLKDYPFDDKWRFDVSDPLWDQPHIHELLAVRTSEAANPLPSSILETLPPYTFNDVLKGGEGALKKLKTILAGSVEGAGNPGMIRTLCGLGENPNDPLRRLRRRVGHIKRNLSPR